MFLSVGAIHMIKQPPFIIQSRAQGKEIQEEWLTIGVELQGMHFLHISATPSVT